MENDVPDLSTAREMRLHASAQALLYDIQRRVRSGYVWWACGEVPLVKVLAVIAKLDRQYDVFASRFQRSRRKAAEEPSAVLFVWPVRGDPAGYTTRFRFLVLATSHLDGEVMYDGRQRPVRVDLYANSGGIYHLRPVQSPGPEPRLTLVWQLTPRCHERMVERLCQAAGQELSAFERVIRSYRQLPMTSGYRQQLKGALQSALPTWRRNNLPSVQAYKQRIRQGISSDPFRESLPFVAGFPKLFDSPPMTLRTYLKVNDKRRKDIGEQRQIRLESEHTEAAL